jgi:putative aldouronate transport system substrate-binding protein
MKKRRSVSIVLGVLLAGVLILGMGACRRESGAAAGSSGGVARVKGSLPLADGNTTLNMFLAESGGANVVSSYTYADNRFTKRVVDDTGVNLNITVGSAANKREQLNLILSAGDYPEVLITDTLSFNDLVYYAGQGILISLDEYDPLGYPNIKAAFDEYPALNERLRSNDGKMYALASVNDCLHCIYSGARYWYFMPWIRDNGLKMPETLDEFTEYLRYVKTHDLNGNGRQDEIPMALEKARLNEFISFLAKPFMPFVRSGNYFGLALDNGKVTEQYKDSRFREALKYMAGLYREGLILADSFSMTQDQLRALVTADTPVLAVVGAPWVNNYTVQPSARHMDFFELRALKGPNGERHAGNQDPWSILSATYYVTDKCKDPELAVALYDYFINFDVQMDSYIGPKGEAWVDAVPNTKSILNLPASHRMIATYGSQPFNATWDQAAPMIRNKKFRGGEEAEGVDDMIRWLRTGDLSLRDSLLNNAAFTNEGTWYLTSWMNEEWTMPQSFFIPPIAFDDNDNSRISDINAVLETFKQQVMVEFITGVRNINDDGAWNNYLAELDRLGSAEMAGIIQKYIK